MLLDECSPPKNSCLKNCIAVNGPNPEWCGDGFKSEGEACDDGNTISGDGCTANCQKETPVCGNGKVEKGFGGESCDDGNTKDGDGCNSKCQKEWCAQCKVTALAECNDLIVWNKEAANSSCTLPSNFFTNTSKLVCLAGEPCTCRIMYDAAKCAVAQSLCYDACIAIEGDNPPPPLSAEECASWKALKNSPWWWKPDIVGLKSDAITEGEAMVKGLFVKKGYQKFLEIWPATISWAEYYSGKEFSAKARDDAKNHAWAALYAAKMNPKIDPTEAAAQYDPNSGQITWAKNLQEYSPEAIVNTGAHEAIHAALDRLFSGKTLTDVGLQTLQIPPGLQIMDTATMTLPKKSSEDPGEVDHYVMTIIQETYPGFINVPLAETTGTKNDLCPATE
jgi:cysteine-rich repeat protein